MKLIYLLYFLFIAIPVKGQDLAKLWEKYFQKDYNVVLEQAIPLLKEYPSNMELSLLIGRSYTDNNNWNQAIPYLRKVIDNDINRSNKAWSMVYLGQCYYYKDSIDLAKKYLNSCIRLNATKNSTNNAIDILEYFSISQFYDSWVIIDTNNIRFHFQNPHYNEEYIKRMSKTYDDLNIFFEAQTPKKIDIYIWENLDEAKTKLKMELAIARFSTVCIHTTYKNTIGHELTHILCFYGLKPKKINNIISEGIAVYFDQTSRDRMKVAQEFLNGKKINVIDLWTNPSNYSGEHNYPVGGALIDFLMKNGTQDQIKEVLRDQTFDNARKVYNNFEKLMEDFNDRINNIKYVN
jgi:tetratricopeptide (TPR) repeat protein